MFRNLLFVFAFSFAGLFAGRALAADFRAETGQGETLTLKTEEGKSFSAYRTGPPEARIGILLVPDAWGVDAQVREWADWLGQGGYRVIVPDLYDGAVAASAAEAERRAAGLRQTDVNARYGVALAALKAPGRKQVAMGWGFGGVQAQQAALAVPHDVHAVVNYEGTPIAGVARHADFSGAVLAMYAKKGGGELLPGVQEFEASMKRLKRPVVIAYFDAQRLGASDGRYSGEAAQLVWKDTEAFLKRYVKTEVKPERKAKKKRKRKK